MVAFTQDIFDAICGRIANGESLRKVCSDQDMPSKSTVMKWLVDDDNCPLSDQYTRARESQADTIFDECLDIADEAMNDVTVKEDGTEIVNHENIQRARLRIDTRKWMAGKMRPKKYGDKQQMELSGGVAVDTVVRKIVGPGS
ncbi:MAG: terminase small subunit protein [Hyphomicrobiales bacterium]|nr:terminase small subunit protein [Hyphomicrobiales bacterium]